MTLIPRIMNLLQESQAEGISVSIGGIIPDGDKEALKKIGIAGIFGPGTNTEDIVSFIKNLYILWILNDYTTAFANMTDYLWQKQLPS